jgi:hypothetical protein
MRLCLELPAGWPVFEEGGGRVVSVPGTPATITISPLMPMPDDPAAYGQKLLREDALPGTTPRVVETRELRTVDGWRISAVETVAVDAAGAMVEKTVTLFYSLRRHAAVVTIRTPSPEVFKTHAQEIMPACLRARPDFSSEVVALAQVVEVSGPARSP